MNLYLAYCAAIAIAAAYRFRHTPTLVAATMPAWILGLKPTNPDFDRYRTSFATIHLDPTAPNWVAGGSGVDAEPLWLLYQAAYKTVAPDHFGLFLAINFAACSWLAYRPIRELIPDRAWRNMAIALLLPVSIPVLFMFSPRSSISFALCFYGLTALAAGRTRGPLLLLAVGASIHSQYIGVALFSAVALLLRRLPFARPTITVAALGAGIVTTAAVLASSLVLPLIEFAPNSVYVSEGVASLSSARQGFRPTGVASAAIAAIALARPGWLPARREEHIDLFVALAVFGGVVAVMFWDAPHIASRLSRLGDYVLIPVLGARGLMVLSEKGSRLAAVAVVMAMLPLVYPGVYASLSGV